MRGFTPFAGKSAAAGFAARLALHGLEPLRQFRHHGAAGLMGHADPAPDFGGGAPTAEAIAALLVDDTDQNAGGFDCHRGKHRFAHQIFTWASHKANARWIDRKPGFWFVVSTPESRGRESAKH